ncbi:hypothetical protein HDU84_002495 [Entophlyctis sp. JEL0112]|nr:hypothetical protein HDU84_002495 [Entophlyctis sp. JEL0112]
MFIDIFGKSCGLSLGQYNDTNGVLNWNCVSDHGDTISPFGDTYMLFTFGYLTIPAWVNVRRPDVSIQESIWVSTGAGLATYLVTGLIPALAYTIPSDSNLIAVMVSQSGTVSKVFGYLFSTTVLMMSIPVFLEITRLNLMQNFDMHPVLSVGLTYVVPWILSIPLQTGNYLLDINVWGSLIFVSTANFVVPLVIYLKAIWFRKAYNQRRYLTKKQRDLLRVIHGNTYGRGGANLPVASDYRALRGPGSIFAADSDQHLRASSIGNHQPNVGDSADTVTAENGKVANKTSQSTLQPDAPSKIPVVVLHEPQYEFYEAVTKDESLGQTAESQVSLSNQGDSIVLGQFPLFASPLQSITSRTPSKSSPQITADDSPMHAGQSFAGSNGLLTVPTASDFSGSQHKADSSTTPESSDVNIDMNLLTVLSPPKKKVSLLVPGEDVAENNPISDRFSVESVAKSSTSSIHRNGSVSSGLAGGDTFQNGQSSLLNRGAAALRLGSLVSLASRANLPTDLLDLDVEKEGYLLEDVPDPDEDDENDEEIGDTGNEIDLGAGDFSDEDGHSAEVDPTGTYDREYQLGLEHVSLKMDEAIGNNVDNGDRRHRFSALRQESANSWFFSQRHGAAPFARSNALWNRSSNGDHADVIGIGAWGSTPDVTASGNASSTRGWKQPTKFLQSPVSMAGEEGSFFKETGGAFAYFGAGAGRRKSMPLSAVSLPFAGFTRRREADSSEGNDLRSNETVLNVDSSKPAEDMKVENQSSGSLPRASEEVALIPRLIISTATPSPGIADGRNSSVNVLPPVYVCESPVSVDNESEVSRGAPPLDLVQPSDVAHFGGNLKARPATIVLEGGDLLAGTLLAHPPAADLDLLGVSGSAGNGISTTPLVSQLEVPSVPSADPILVPNRNSGDVRNAEELNDEGFLTSAKSAENVGVDTVLNESGTVAEEKHKSLDPLMNSAPLASNNAGLNWRQLWHTLLGGKGRGSSQTRKWRGEAASSGRRSRSNGRSVVNPSIPDLDEFREARRASCASSSAGRSVAHKHDERPARAQFPMSFLLPRPAPVAVPPPPPPPPPPASPASGYAYASRHNSISAAAAAGGLGAPLPLLGRTNTTQSSTGDNATTTAHTIRSTAGASGVFFHNGRPVAGVKAFRSIPKAFPIKPKTLAIMCLFVTAVTAVANVVYVVVTGSG